MGKLTRMFLTAGQSESSQSQNKIGLLSLVWLAVICSALAVVYISHLCRQLQDELSLLEREANNLQVEWGQYLLEQSYRASLNRIENMAKNRLQMRVPNAEEIIVVRVPEFDIE